MRALQIVQLGVLLDPQRSPSQMLVDWWPLVDTAEMVAHAGAQVSVIQASRVAETVRLRDVTYHFLVPERQAHPDCLGGLCAPDQAAGARCLSRARSGFSAGGR